MKYTEKITLGEPTALLNLRYQENHNIDKR